MKNNFDKAFHFIIGIEGGYVNNPNDPGGETKYGISKIAYPKMDIKKLTIDDAREIYKRDYWNKINADVLPDRIDIAIFDTCINTGIKMSIKLFQRAINNISDSKIIVDGILGPKTLTAAESAECSSLLYSIFFERCSYYTQLADRNPKLEKFLKGWMNRVIKLRNYLVRT